MSNEPTQKEDDMNKQWFVLDAEKINETDKALQYNLDQTVSQTGGFKVWVPKSCVQENYIMGNYEVTLIKKWIVLKNLWLHTKPKCFSCISE